MSASQDAILNWIDANPEGFQRIVVRKTAGRKVWWRGPSGADYDTLRECVAAALRQGLSTETSRGGQEMNTKPGIVLLLQECRRDLAAANRSIATLTSQRDDLNRRLRRFACVRIEQNRETHCIDFRLRMAKEVAEGMATPAVGELVLDELREQIMRGLSQPMEDGR